MSIDFSGNHPSPVRRAADGTGGESSEFSGKWQATTGPGSTSARAGSSVRQISSTDVLARTIEAGRTERALSGEWSDRQTRTAMPALRVADCTMSSVSAAS